MAARDAVELSRKVSPDGMDMRRVVMITEIHELLDGFLAAMVDTSYDLEVLYTASRAVELNPDAQMRLVRTFLDTYKVQLAERDQSRSYSVGNVAQGQLLDICDVLLEHGHLAPDVRALLQTSLRSVLKALSKDSHTRSRYTDALSELKNYSADRYYEIISHVESLGSPSAMETFLDVFEESNKTKRISSLIKERVALLVLRSPHASLEQQRRVVDFLSGSSVSRVLQSIEDPASQAVVIYEHGFYHVPDNMLALCAEPAEVLKHLIKQTDFEERFYMTSLTSSRFFDTNMVGLLPLSALTAVDLSVQKTAEVVETALLELFEHEYAVQNLESLGDEYLGSFDELMAISRAL
jgi:hypothetical protein